ncbi:MAG: hypothetical protein ACRETJ_08230 [Steroidobacteraceae bacterium]
MALFPIIIALLLVGAVLSFWADRLEARIRLGEEEAKERGTGQAGATLAEALRGAVAAQRRALLELRAHSVIGDDAFHVAEGEIDLLELTADERVRPET